MYCVSNSVFTYICHVICNNFPINIYTALNIPRISVVAYSPAQVYRIILSVETYVYRLWS